MNFRMDVEKELSPLVHFLGDWTSTSPSEYPKSSIFVGHIHEQILWDAKKKKVCQNRKDNTNIPVGILDQIKQKSAIETGTEQLIQNPATWFKN